MRAQFSSLTRDLEKMSDAEASRVYRTQQKLLAFRLAAATTGLLRWSRAILEAYSDLKERRALLDFSDLVGKTVALLQTCPVAWVLYKLDRGIDHILVDEAQDTAPEQWSILEILSAEFFAHPSENRNRARSLFVVGDSKQSIFSFQGADRTLFTRMRSKLRASVVASAHPWKEVELPYSFRSAPEILAIVDQTFREEASEGVSEGETLLRHKPIQLRIPGQVTLWPICTTAEQPTEHEKMDSALWHIPTQYTKSPPGYMLLAKKIARKISIWTKKPPEGASPPTKFVLHTTKKQISPGDVLILLRARRGIGPALLRELKARGLPVAGADRMRLTDQIAIMDLISLGRFLLLPDDDLRLAEVLKSPLFEVSEEDLFAIAHRRRGSLWSALCDDAWPRFSRIRRTLEEWLAAASFARPFELFLRILEEGGRDKLLARLGVESAEALDEFLSLALTYEQQHPPSLQGFLDWMQKTQSEIKRDLEKSRDAVRVMTVHAAKGLEAPIVILADAARAYTPVQGVLWRREERTQTYVPLANPGENDLSQAAMQVRAQIRKEQKQEERRLLYVAMTRAQERLFICGWGKSIAKRGLSQAGGSENWHRLVERGFLRLHRTAQLSEKESFRVREKTVRSFSDNAHSASLWRLHSVLPSPVAGRPSPQPDETDLPIWTKPSHTRKEGTEKPWKITSPSGLQGASAHFSAQTRDTQSIRARDRGIAVHRLLEILPSRSSAQRERIADGYLRTAHPSWSAQEREEVTGKVSSILEGAEFAWIFQLENCSEVSLVLRASKAGERRFFSGRIDYLGVRDREVVVVEYKSGSMNSQARGGYLRQMSIYRRMLEPLFPKRRIRCFLLWTDVPKLEDISASTGKHPQT